MIYYWHVEREITNEEYAREIASIWNVADSGHGYVTRFTVRRQFMDRYVCQQLRCARNEARKRRGTSGSRRLLRVAS